MAASVVAKRPASVARTATRACSQGETSARMAFSSTMAVIASATRRASRRKAGMAS